MDSFEPKNMEKSTKHTTRCSSIERSGGAIIIGASAISSYVRSQYSKNPLFINIPYNIVVPISKIGNLENITTKIKATPNTKENTNLRTQYIFRKQIIKQLKYILSSINKYWQIIEFDYYNYDIFEIDTIPGFYIVERRVKDCYKSNSDGHSHSHKRIWDCDEIVRLFIHNEVVLINTNDSNDSNPC